MERIKKSRALTKLKYMFGSSRRIRRLSPSEIGCNDMSEGYGKPGVCHATIVIFLEFFAWGLLTSPTIQALKRAFPTGTFLMNGIVQGVKGILSFLSAPLLGSLSDAWGRKPFLLLSVFFTCAPIPILLYSTTAYFIALAFSGIFAVTFSIVFAYVADCTNENERSYSYGLVSATFAASLVISPALGTYIIGSSATHGETQVVLLATMVALFNVLFIVFMVPESLKSRKPSWGLDISWKQADPFAALFKAGTDVRLLRLSIIVFLSYLPEAGQYSCFFLYLQKVVGFSLDQVAVFIAILCVTSVASQTLFLSWLMSCFGYKYTIILGLIFQAVQLFIYGVWTSKWLMWVAGVFAAVSSFIYPAISALVSKNASSEEQGAVLGILTGIRGLCNGLGPAIFGLLFWMFDVNLSGDGSSVAGHEAGNLSKIVVPVNTGPVLQELFKGVPFFLGVFPVILAILVSLCIKESESLGVHHRRSSDSPSPSRPNTDTTAAATVPVNHRSHDPVSPVYVELRQSTTALSQ